MPADQQQRVESEIASFVDFALRPGQVAPPTIRFEEKSREAGPVTVTVRPLRPEDAVWNQWRDGTPRLFNNRMAQAFDVEIVGPAPLIWLPNATQLELNDESVVLFAAPTADIVLGELLYWALQQERWVLDGDLVARTRAAGPFRTAYMDLSSFEDGVLGGVIAFPTLYDDVSGQPASAAMMHVVALRLTVAVQSAEGIHDVVFVYD